MRDARQVLDDQFLDMRAKALALAADFDRVQRHAGGGSVLESDGRVRRLRQALQLLLSDEGDRARRLQMIFSDQTPPP